MGIKGHNWVTRRIVTFVQDHATKEHKAAQKYGSSYGGTIFTVKPSEASKPRPRDASGHEIPPPPRPPDPVYGPAPINQPRITQERAHGTRRDDGPVMSFPEPPGMVRRFVHHLLVEERRVTNRPEPPPQPHGRIGGLMGTPWSPWEREDPPGTRDRRDDPNPSGWGPGGGGGNEGGGPIINPNPPPGYRS